MNVNYYQLHYHMKHCGAKFVIDNIFEALKTFSNYNLNMLYSEKHSEYSYQGVNSIDVPELDYDDKVFSSKEELEAYAKKVMEKIKSNLDLDNKCVLHTHNVNLMKSSYLGRAIQLLSDDQINNPNFKIIMQVHDFAEDNRKHLLELMQNASGSLDADYANKLAYPVSKNITYCTINSRDKDLLEKIGINNVILFANNIDCEYLTSEAKPSGLIEEIEKYAHDNEYQFDRTRYILLSPLKIIKRKNVIETLLILNKLNQNNDEWQLLITLDAHSTSDKEYSDAIKRYVKENKLPVVIGFGYSLISPNKERTDEYKYNLRDLFEISNCIITTSVLEGFGMSYLEGWVADEPVIGRRLDFIFKDFEANNIELSHFYDKLIVNGKDFKDYDYKEQLDLLNTCECDISKIEEFLFSDKSDIIEKNKKAIINNYSLESYYKKIQELINQTKDKDEVVNNSYLIEFFGGNK